MIDLKQSIGNKLVQAGLAHREFKRAKPLIHRGQKYCPQIFKEIEIEDDGELRKVLCPMLVNESGDATFRGYGLGVTPITLYVPESYIKRLKE